MTNALVFIAFLFMGVFGLWLLIFMIIVTYRNMREIEEQEAKNEVQSSKVVLP